MFSVDDIVSQILTDLNGGARKVCPVTVTNNDNNTKKNKNEITLLEKTQLSGELDGHFIANRVISLSDIQERMGRATHLFISPKAILTPSARDEIRRKNISVAVRIPTTETKTTWFAVHEPATFSEQILKQFTKKINCENKKPVIYSTLEQLFDAAVTQTHIGTKSLITLTHQVAKAAQMGNQNKSIRAILGFDAMFVAEDAREINANMLIIHPKRQSETKIVEIIQEFIER
ncbi:MAG: hypothetical protein ACRCUY_13720 [Thermoguttaceae bacterium]